MTENNAETPVEGAESDSERLSAHPEGEGADIIPDEPQKLNKEMRYRLERNQAREELAATQERIQAMMRSDIERVAGEVLSQGSDIFMSGNDVSAFLNDEGHIDYDRVREDAQILLSERPGLRKLTPGYDPSQGFGGKPPAKGGPASWADLFKS
jgi:hypothetical protein